MMLLCIIFLLTTASADALYNRLNYITKVEELLNTCSRSRSNYHKEQPSKENGLNQTCKPWRDRSCCTVEMEKQMHSEQALYNFEYSHCHKKISKECLRHFRREHCMTACSPNAGPWLVKVNGYKVNRERIYKMPLCQFACDQWWYACQNELTCVRVWSNEFHWTKNGNSCPKHARCVPFKEVYKNSSDFCETIWDDKWRVVPDRYDRCFRLDIEPGSNSNDAVAKYWGSKLIAGQGRSSALRSAPYRLLSVLPLNFLLLFH